MARLESLGAGGAGGVRIPLSALAASRVGKTRHRKRARESLLEFTTYTKHEYEAAHFHAELAAKLDRFLQDCVDRKSPRLIVQAPPRHGKSELISRRFPAYALGRYEWLEIIGASYALALAKRMNSDMQRIMDSPEYHEVFPGTRIPAKGRDNPQGKKRNDELVELLNGPGSYRAAGVNVGISGMGAHIATIDDPVKDAQDAGSATMRESVWDWYVSTLYTRLAPGGGVLVVQTRWHEDDLAGRLIEASDKAEKAAESEDEEARIEAEDFDVFEVIDYPAIALEDEEHRKEGEALHPERYPLRALRRIKQTMGDYYWSALYQQRPAPPSGDIFRSEWWQYYCAYPSIVMVRIYADTALKTKEVNDWSVFQAWGLGSDGRIYLLDQIRRKWESPELETEARAFWAKWTSFPIGQNVPPAMVMRIEDKASGTGLVQSLQRPRREAGVVSGMPIVVEAIPRDTDKVTRARSGAPQIQAGNVVLPDPEAMPTPWLSDYLSEFASFTAALSHKHDDQIDPTLDAIHDMILGDMDFYAAALG